MEIRWRVQVPAAPAPYSLCVLRDRFDRVIILLCLLAALSCVGGVWYLYGQPNNGLNSSQTGDE
jgi:hypothetical protein